MPAPRPGRSRSVSWSMEDIPYRSLVHDRVHGDNRLFYALASASFIEITSDLYARNLVEYFRHDVEVAEWLEGVWVREELQHGAALKRYVQTAWPDFAWEAAYRSFFAEYSRICTVDQLASTRALEMVARCVVETGTATFYRMLAESTDEPVLSCLAGKIHADEVRHYKHFYRYFLRYRALERPSRMAVLRTLWNRATAVETEDAFHAFKALFLARHPNSGFRKADYDVYCKSVLRVAKRRFPYNMTMKMLLKPLDLNAALARAILPAATSGARFLLQRYGERS